MSEIVLSYDLGGTKVAIGVVNSRGKILDQVWTPVVFDQGKKAVLKQLTDLGKSFLKKYPKIKRIGIASAGPLDPQKGELLNPTNFAAGGEPWGKVPLAKILKTNLKRATFLENDAAAAILAEHWVGAAKKVQNCMILTLGTGLGTGIICNGELVRSGRHLHPEAGHLIVRFNDTSALCGCGNYGCAEAYLSGRNFGKRAALKLSKPELTAKDVTLLAEQGDAQALAIFEEYAEIMAVAMYNYVRIYSPETIILTGSFANAMKFFLPKTKMHLEKYLAQGSDLVPKIVGSSLSNHAGIIGGAYIAFHRGKSIPTPTRS